jgi:hypothetical protein
MYWLIKNGYGFMIVYKYLETEFNIWNARILIYLLYDLCGYMNRKTYNLYLHS